MQVQKMKKGKVIKNNARIYEKKNERSENYKQALREVKCAYSKKNVFSSEVNTAVLETF